MLFTSLAFLIFAVCLFFIYYLVPKKGQWIVLLIGSGVFYFWAGWKYFLFLVATIIVTYLLGLWLGHIFHKENQEIDLLKQQYGEDSSFKAFRKEIKRKYNIHRMWVCALGIIIEIGTLFFLKYFNFFGSIFTSIFYKDKVFNGLDLIVPVGLSFYIFSSVGYLIDVNRGIHDPEKNIFKFALFISFFPIVLQGPICTYQDLSKELYEGHQLNGDNVSSGFRRVILGFFKKIVIADLIGIVVNTLFNNYTEYHGVILLFAGIFYAIQLYADFSGFMDIAIGYAEMLGIKLPENFDTPYFSHSISEFWRRWHITLGTWFRNYLYFPILRSSWIGKMKKGLSKINKKFADIFVTIIALIIVWLSTGLWHGASYNFILWGCFHGFFIILDAALSSVYSKMRKLLHISDDNKAFKVFQIIRTFYLVTVSFFLFRATTLTQAWGMFVESLKIWDWNQITDSTMISLGIDWWMYIVILGAILITIFANSLFRNPETSKMFKYDLSKKLPTIVRLSCLVLITWIIIGVYLYEKSLGSITSAFIYFEF